MLKFYSSFPTSPKYNLTKEMSVSAVSELLRTASFDTCTCYSRICLILPVNSSL